LISLEKGLESHAAGAERRCLLYIRLAQEGYL